MSTTTEMLKTNHRFIPKLIHDYYPTWMTKVFPVLITMRAYNIATGAQATGSALYIHRGG